MISNNFLRMHFEHSNKLQSLTQVRYLLSSNNRIFIRSLHKELPTTENLTDEELDFLIIVAAYLETYIKNRKDIPIWIFDDLYYGKECKLQPVPHALSEKEIDNLRRRNISYIHPQCVIQGK